MLPISEAQQLRLVMVLAHFLWQGALIIVGFRVLTALFKVRRATMRYVVSLGAFLSLAACPVVTWFAMPEAELRPQVVRTSPDLRNNVDVTPIVDEPGDRPVTATNATPQSDVDPSSSTSANASDEQRLSTPVAMATTPVEEVADNADPVWWRPAVPWVVGCWLLGVIVFSLRLLGGAGLTWSWRRDAASLPASLQRQVERLCGRLRMTVPLVRTSVRVAEAVAVGLFRPMILLPVAWVTELPPDMLEAVIAHELAHLRRFDLWVNLFQGLVETLLFYHPAVWWLSRQVRRERELCCDELAVAVTQNSLRYAEMLEQVSRMRFQRTSPLAMTISGPKHLLLDRVRNVLQPTPRGDVRNGTMAVLLLMSVLTVGLLSNFLSFGHADAATDEAPISDVQYVARFVDGPSIELLAVGTHQVEPQEWWRADGVPLAERPRDVAARQVTFSSATNELDQEACREVIFRVTGVSDAETHLTYQWIVNGRADFAHRAVVRGTTEFSVGESPYQKPGQTAPETTTLRLGIGELPELFVVTITPDGKKVSQTLSDEEAEQLDACVRPIQVVETDGQAELILEQVDRARTPIAVWYVPYAIDKSGKSHELTRSGGRPDVASSIYPIPLSEVARFEVRFRRYRHHAVFENVSLEPGKRTDAKVSVLSPPKPTVYRAELPDGRSVEFVGITKNTRPANEGWRPDGRAIGDVGYWPSTTVLHNGNWSSGYEENGPHPEPDATAMDFLFRFNGLKGQPSLRFELPTHRTSYPNRPLKEPYEVRIAGDLRGDPPPGGKWATPNDVVRVGLSDDPWGEWLQVDLTGKILNPPTAQSLYRADYESIEVVGVKDHERAPNKLALVLKHHHELKTKVDFEIRGVDADGKAQWVTEWEGHSRGNDLYELNYGLGSAEKQPTVRYEFRLRPYRHWVTFKGVSLEPGKSTEISIESESFDPPAAQPVVAQATDANAAQASDSDEGRQKDAPLPGQSNDPVKELAAFQGTWCWDLSQPWVWPQPIGVGTNGEGRNSEKRWIVKGNQISWISQEAQRINVSFTIDPTKTPKQIDFTFLNGPNKGAKCLGIYEPQQGNPNYLWLCLTNPGSNASRPTDISADSLKQQSMIGIYPVAPHKKPSAAKALERLQGVWQMELCDSTTETFGGTQQEVSKWQWTIKGDEILWSRQDQLWKMKLEVDPSKSPNEIDLTYLDGPYKGKKCQGMYVLGGVDGQTLMISIQDPGSQAPRPKDISMRGSVKTSLIFLRPSEPSDNEREIGSFQGTWTLRNFDTGGTNNDPSSWPLPAGKGPDKFGDGS